MTFTFGAGLRDASLHPLADHLPLEFREHRKQPDHGASRRSGEVQCFRQRDEGNPEISQLGQRRDQVSQGSAPAVSFHTMMASMLLLRAACSSSSRLGLCFAPEAVSCTSKTTCRLRWRTNWRMAFSCKGKVC